MKKLMLMGMAASALLITSCSQEETTNIQNPGEIRYRVSSDNQTRASEDKAGYCANKLPESFKAYAKTADGKVLFSGDVLTYESGKWTNASGVRYWPNEGDVTFYGSVNGDVKMSAGNAEPTIDFTVNADAAAQKDLLYARKTAAKGSGDVAMNFRHALSQIVFKAKKTNANLHVVIEEIAVANVPVSGTFTFPSADTDVNILDHTQSLGQDPDGANRGSWALNPGTTTYRVSAGTTPITVGASTDFSATGETNSKALLLLPCNIKAWDLTAPNYTEQAYFLIKCKIYNVAGDTFNEATDVCLWGSDGAKDIVIPADFNWTGGKKYTYTFLFGNGGGGITPTPDDPQPVLVPISFTVTVDDFIKGSDSTLELNEDKTTDVTEN